MDAEELIQEIIDLLNGPDGGLLPCIADEENLYSVITDLLDDYNKLDEIVSKIHGETG